MKTEEHGPGKGETRKEARPWLNRGCAMCSQLCLQVSLPSAANFSSPFRLEINAHFMRTARKHGRTTFSAVLCQEGQAKAGVSAVKQAVNTICIQTKTAFPSALALPMASCTSCMTCGGKRADALGIAALCTCT
eukprot:1160167-Pelagomonas_calceolata.AAC.4